MNNALLSESSSKTESKAFFSFLINFLIEPIKSGLYGYAAFFTVLILTKGLIYISGFASEYVVNGDDVLFSLLGLIIVFLVKLADNIKNKSSG